MPDDDPIIKAGFYMPASLRKEIKRESVETGKDMSEIVIEQMTRRYPQLSPRKARAPKA